MPDPVRWKIHSAAITALFNLFFDHLLTINLELHATLPGIVRDGRFVIFGIFLGHSYKFFLVDVMKGIRSPTGNLLNLILGYILATM